MFNVSSYKQLIRDFGRDMDLSHTTGGTYDAATSSMTGETTVVETFRGYTGRARNAMAQPETPIYGQRMVYLMADSLTFVPVEGDKIATPEFDDTMTVTSVRSVWVKGVPELYILEASQ